MIKGKKILAIIPARGGSKGLIGKNLRLLGGFPLLYWTIKAAKGSSYIDRLILSSEDEKIISTAKKYGCQSPFCRPPELARDDTPGIEPILHALGIISGYDYIIVLQPTSPLRLAEDIDACLTRCISAKANCCVSVTETGKPPFWTYLLDKRHRLLPIIKNDKKYVRRQDMPKTYQLNGAVYVAKVEWLKKHKTFLTDETIAYVMPAERSIDIDSEFDLSLCEHLLSKGPSARGS